MPPRKATQGEAIGRDGKLKAGYKYEKGGVIVKVDSVKKGDKTAKKSASAGPNKSGAPRKVNAHRMSGGEQSTITQTLKENMLLLLSIVYLNVFMRLQQFTNGFTNLSFQSLLEDQHHKDIIEAARRLKDFISSNIPIFTEDEIAIFRQLSENSMVEFYGIAYGTDTLMRIDILQRYVTSLIQPRETKMQVMEVINEKRFIDAVVAFISLVFYLQYITETLHEGVIGDVLKFQP